MPFLVLLLISVAAGLGAAFLARRISVRVRELGAGGMPDHLVQVWMDVAVKAGVARLRELSHVLSQPKRNDH